MTPEQLDALIEEEAVRKRIERLIGTKRSESGVSAFFKHPATLLVLGFLLSGVIANWLTGEINSRRSQAEVAAEWERARISTAIQAVQDLARLIDERDVRGERLADALRRGAPPSVITTLRTDYETSVVAWGRNYHSNLITVRNILNSEATSPVEDLITDSYVPLVDSLDERIMLAVEGDVSQRESDLFQDIEELSGIATECGSSMTALLFDLLQPDRAVEEDSWFPSPFGGSNDAEVGELQGIPAEDLALIRNSCT